MDVGRHCDFCGQLDFLPFDCKSCGGVFCDSHRFHDCESTRQRTKSSAAAVARPAPQKPAPQKPAPQSTARVAEQPGPRTCKPEKVSTSEPKKGLTERALAALERLRAQSQKRTAAKPTQQAKFDLKTLKLQAKGDSKVPDQDRIYVWLRRPEHKYKNDVTGNLESRPQKQVAWYFSKTQKVGKVIDMATKPLSIPANGKYHVTLDNSSAPLPASDILGSCVSSGATLIISA